jgi:hypothetical protein
MTYLVDYDKESFSRLLKMFEDHFSALLYPNQRAEPHLFHHLQVLSLLYDVNKKAAASGASHVPYSDFYCEALAKKVDFKADYNRWRKQLSAHAQGYIQRINIHT